MVFYFFFFKQKTAYEMRISDWSSDVCSSDLLGMARRPITVYDANWKLVCMLCTELPSIEKGTAVPEKTADGKDGIAVTFTLRPDAEWGDGVPVTTKDVVFTWEVGRNPKTGVGNLEMCQSGRAQV